MKQQEYFIGMVCIQIWQHFSNSLINYLNNTLVKLIQKRNCFLKIFSKMLAGPTLFYGFSQPSQEQEIKFSHVCYMTLLTTYIRPCPHECSQDKLVPWTKGSRNKLYVIYDKLLGQVQPKFLRLCLCGQGLRHAESVSEQTK